MEVEPYPSINLQDTASTIPILPYSRIVGQEQIKLALEIAYVAPQRLGGVLISGQRGTGKSTAVRAFARVVYGQLPVTLPINATEDRVVGGWKIDALMQSNPEWQSGLLKEANDRLLYVDEVNLLDDHIVLNNLATLYYAQGHYSEAEPLYKRSWSIYEGQLGADHPDIAQSLNNLANLYCTQGRYSEAKPLYERSLSIYEGQLGANHPTVATSLNNLAELHRSQGYYSQAEPLFERSLSIRKKQLGADHPDIAQSFNNLAGLYDSQGRHSEAEPLYGRSLDICFQKLGQEHPTTQVVLKNFVTCLQDAIAANQSDRLSNHPLTQDILTQLRES